MVRSGQSLKLTLFLMKACGGLPPKNEKRRALYQVYSFGVIVGLGALFVISQMVNLFYEHDLDLIADNSFLMVEQTSFLCKALVLVLCNKEIISMFEMLESPTFLAHSSCQEPILKAAMSKVVRNSRMFHGSVLVCCSSIVLTPILKGERILPSVGWFPFATESLPVFVLTYIWQSSSILITATLNASIDLVSSGLLVLVCGQIEVLTDSLNQIGKPIDDERQSAIREKRIMIKTISPTIPATSFRVTDLRPFDDRKVNREPDVYLEAVKCVQHHHAILTFLDTFESVFSYGILSQFAASVLVICITAFELTNISLTDVKAVNLITYQIVMLSEIFLYCWYGNEIVQMSLKISDAAYGANWDQCSKRVQLALCLIMKRAQKPVRLTAGKILQLTLETFTAILRMSYSFLAFLQQMKQDDVNKY